MHKKNLDLGKVEEKRHIPKPIANLLKWDQQATGDLIQYVTRNFPNLASKSELKFMELSCNGLVWITASLIMIYIDILFPRQFSINLLIALLIDVAATGILKAFTRRRRPATRKADVCKDFGPDKFSFPSGHASRSMLITLIFSQISPLFNSGAIHFLLASFLWIWAFAVCASRILNGRHYLLDIVGGIVAGLLTSKLVSWLWMSPDQVGFILHFFKIHDMSVDVE